MLDLHFSDINGESIIYSKYSFQTHHQFLYIEPAKDAFAQQVNPLENIDTLIMDTLQTAQTIMSCNKYMKYLCKVAENGIVFEKNFWQHTDFFSDDTNPEVVKIKAALLAYVEKYGTPTWELEKNEKAPLPLSFRVSSARKKDNLPNDYLKTFLMDKIALVEEGNLYPLCSFTLFFLYSYDLFLFGSADNRLRRVEHCRLYFNSNNSSPELCAKAVGLVPSLRLAFIVFTISHHKAIRICKNCGTLFITTDARTEYCSSKCRSSYNTAQSRKRKKANLQ